MVLAPALRRLPALEKLGLGDNPFGDEGLDTLVAPPPPPAGALPPPTGGLTKLKVLTLDRTQVTDAGCAALAAALPRQRRAACAQAPHADWHPCQRRVKIRRKGGTEAHSLEGRHALLRDRRRRW